MGHAENTALITIEVAYATPARQRIITVQTAPETPLIDAVHQSQITELFPEVDLSTASFGIWGKVKPRQTPMQDGQRIEIYRPLVADPKETRRKRAQKRTTKNLKST